MSELLLKLLKLTAKDYEITFRNGPKGMFLVEIDKLGTEQQFGETISVDRIEFEVTKNSKWVEDMLLDYIESTRNKIEGLQ